MPLIVGNTYPARVDKGRFVTSGNKDTPGVEVAFNCGASGSIVHTIYITPGSIDVARKQLNSLGVSDGQLESDEFYEKIGEWVTGAECSIVIGDDEYEGKKKLVVKFINGAQKSGSKEQAQQVASLFRSSNQTNINSKYSSAGRGSNGQQSGPPDDWQPSDNDAPPPSYGKRY